LLAAKHVWITHYDLAGGRWARCLCGYVEPVFHDWPDRCGLDWVLRSRTWLSPEQFDRDVARAWAASCREQKRLAAALAAAKR